MSDSPDQSAPRNTVRVTETGEVEFFDGQRWRAYVELPGDGPDPLGVIIRGDDR